jgi:large subunit ribosomal protein L27
MAHKKAGGSTSLGRDSESKRLGVKTFGGQKVWPGVIIVRQKGTKFHPGPGVKKGRDDTLYATIKGEVFFQQKKVKRFDNKLLKRKFACVKPVKH